MVKRNLYNTTCSKKLIEKTGIILFSLFAILILNIPASAQSNEDCFMCHDDNELRGEQNGRNISIYLSESRFSRTVHSELECIDCHQDIDAEELPHREFFETVDCSLCHDAVGEDYAVSLHGQAHDRGDPLAPLCKSCHGYHYILPVADHNSRVAPLKIPFLCGRCHKEGAPVQRQRNIPKGQILENYSLSIHGAGLLQKGLIVSATCVSCHSDHKILPHTDSRSSIARQNIANTCSACHAEIEAVHRKIIKGELWEKEAHILPACVDCHQPHQIRKVFYNQGMSDEDCLRCHEDPTIVAKEDGRSLFADYNVHQNSIHKKITCSQCHSEVNVSKLRPCSSITQKVDCSACHSEIGEEYLTSTHGILSSKNEANAPVCKECHGTHNVLGKTDPNSPSFAINIPTLCARCHREGEQAAVRNTGAQIDIVQHYTESIHGKGLLKSGLTVTATCTNCHTAHHELPHNDAESTINKNNISATCGGCHHGIQESFEKSVHSPSVTKTDKELPVCSDCHSAHTISRADTRGFKLEIMQQCGKCHESIADTYFDTYHGKVSQLGYTKTAKCYDCHGAHDILPTDNPKSHLSFENIVETCKSCHPGAHRQFAGYFTHATHHDPQKYPILFWTFWGMTGLLVGKFLIVGLHTILWLPRSLQWKRELTRRMNSNNDSSNEADVDTETTDEKTDE
jgi:hypothetical protein